MRTIIRIYVRHYRDSGQTTAYVDWSDGAKRDGLKLEKEPWG